MITLKLYKVHDCIKIVNMLFLWLKEHMILTFDSWDGLDTSYSCTSCINQVLGGNLLFFTTAAVNINNFVPLAKLKNVHEQ